MAAKVNIQDRRNEILKNVYTIIQNTLVAGNNGPWIESSIICIAMRLSE